MELKEVVELIKAVSDSELRFFEYENEKEVVRLKKDSEGNRAEIIAKNSAGQPIYIPVPMPMPASQGAMSMPMPQGTMPVPQGAMPMPQVAQNASQMIMPQEAKEDNAYTEGTKDSCNVVESPLVGTFYAAASPDEEPFVKIGDKVKKGQKLGIIEAMKLMNDIESDFDGEIVDILVTNENMVEYGQPLFKIK